MDILNTKFTKSANIDLQWLKFCRQSFNQIFRNYFQEGCRVLAYNHIQNKSAKWHCGHHILIKEM